MWKHHSWVMLWVFLCGARGFGQPPEVLTSDVVEGRYGVAVVTAGDLNGDGYSDLAVGADGFDTPFTDAGVVHIYYGSALGIGTTPDDVLSGDQDSGRFGSALAPAGDVNADGYDDLLVASRFVDAGSVDDGAAYLFLGSPQGIVTAAVWVVDGAQFNSGFGISIDGAGDVNGDGFADVIVGAANYDGSASDVGRALLYLGSATGLLDTPDWVVEGSSASAFLGRSVAGVGDVDADGFDDVCVGAPQAGAGGTLFLFRGSAAGLSTIADTTIPFAQGGAQFGRALAGAGDVNGDGFADVIVGARRYDNGESDEGGAFLYAGSATGLQNTPLWTFEGGASNAQAGTWVAGLGDVDGDGLGEVAIGAPLAIGSVPEAGRIVVVAGTVDGTTPLLFDLFGAESGVGWGTQIECAGDLNGDGFGEFAFGVTGASTIASGAGEVRLQWGRARLPLAPHTHQDGRQPDALWGSALSRGGDVNGDGLDDVLIGSRRVDGITTDAGAVSLFVGLNDGIDRGWVPAEVWSAAGTQFNEAFAITIAIAGDVNGDGFEDVLVGSSNYDGDLTDEGRATLYLGTATGVMDTPIWEVEGDQEFCFFGRYVSGAGDVNGDGFADIIVGSPEFDAPEVDEGRAFLYLGSATGPSLTPDWTFDGDQVAAALGRPVASAGDVNGDGFDDVLVSARRFDAGESNEGRVFLFLGSASGLGLTPDWTFDGDQNNALFGIALGGAGDVDGDGFDDVLIGANQFSNDQFGEGRAFLFRGSAAGLGAAPDWTAEGDQIDARFGESVSGIGDLNSDGFADVLVGAPGFDISAAEANTPSDLDDAGRVWVYLGSANGLSTVAATLFSGDQAGARFGGVTSGAGDVDGNGFADFMVSADGYDDEFSDEGRVYLYLGSATGVTRAFEQRQVEDGRPIPHHGASDAPDAFDITGVPHSAAGRSALTLHWQRVRRGSLGSLTADDPAEGFDDVLPMEPTASARMSGLEPGVPYRWRARWVSNRPRFPRSPWFRAHGGAFARADLRTQPLLPGVTMFECVGNGGDVSLQWASPILYDTLELSRDGSLLTTLAGDATSYVDMGLGIGDHTYTLVGRIGNETSVVRTCALTLAPAGVIDMTCLSQPAGVSLLWSEPLPYDEVRVVRDGVQVAVLPGGVGSFADQPLLPGTYDYAVIGVVTGFTATAETCVGVVAEPDRYVFEIGTPNFPYQPETGFGTSSIVLRVRELPTNVGFPHGLQGLSMALRWDERLAGVDFAPSPSLLALNQGVGPDFLGNDVGADVATVVCVASFMDPSETLSAEAPLDVGEVRLETVESAWTDEFLGSVVTVDWEDGLGNALPVNNSVVVGAQSIAAELQSGSLTMVPTLTQFRRGDCNASDSINVSDVIFLLTSFFVAGNPVCLDACDTNDDGVLDLSDGISLAFHLFAMGAPPPPPYPGCGIDGFTDTIGCNDYTPCP